MDAKTDRFKRLQYLKAVARIQYEYKDWLDQTEQRFLPMGLRVADLKEQIRRARLSDFEPSFMEMNNKFIGVAIQGLIPLSRVSVSVQVGGTPKGEKGSGKRIIRVGYMWRYKVYRPLYEGTKKDFKSWIILSADRVRVNSKIMNLYEVKAFDYRSGQTVQGYVAQAKETEKKHTAFGHTAKEAIKATERLMLKDIDKVMGIERN
jgi:hypothetical protein